MRYSPVRPGFTLTECVVATAVGVLLLATTFSSLPKVQGAGLTEADANQIRMIHTAMLRFAAGSEGGRMPIPGRVNRRPIGTSNVPGAGEEDFSKNRTQCLHSAMVAQQYYNTQVLVGPTEVNPIVRVYGTYNFAAHNPSADTYWDGDVASGGTLPLASGLRARIDGVAGTDECNVSYAQLLMAGLRKEVHWRESAGSGRPHLATRGCKNGVTIGDEYQRSPTLRLHGPPTVWEGNVCFGDSHLEFVIDFVTPTCTYGCGAYNGGQVGVDNLFRTGGTTPAEFTGEGCVMTQGSALQPWAGGDTMLGIHYNLATQFIAVPSWDRLLSP